MPTSNVLRVVVAGVAVTEARAEAVAVGVAAAGDVVLPMAPHSPPSTSMTRPLSLLCRRQTLLTSIDTGSLVPRFRRCTRYGSVCSVTTD